MPQRWRNGDGIVMVIMIMEPRRRVSGESEDGMVVLTVKKMLQRCRCGRVVLIIDSDDTDGA